MPNPEMVAVIAKGLRDGLPHPGDRVNHQRGMLIRIPGMNTFGLPAEVLSHMAKDAGLPSSDMSKLVAEALVNLIETDGGSEIVRKSELKELREGAHRGDQIKGGEHAQESERQGAVDG
jgi:hypothetical protein